MEGVYSASRSAFTFLVLLRCLRIYRSDGIMGLLDSAINLLREIPGFNSLLSKLISNEAKGVVKQLTKGSSPARSLTSLPETGKSHKEILEELLQLKEKEQHVSRGEIFAYVYKANEDHSKLLDAINALYEKSGLGESHDEFLAQVYSEFSHANALSPTVFPSLLRLENEVINMVADMLNGDTSVCGSMTSGGTESILMAMKTYRDMSRKLSPHIKKPEVIAPITIHPAFEKAAHYFDLKIIHVPVDSNFKADLKEIRKSINSNTILIVASAPQYVHGVVDPISEISDIALQYGLPFHVDACFGGFMLPWVEKLGYAVPLFDFRVPGVTSISADIHKYGFGNKGSSVILYRNSEIRKFQYFAYSKWPGGLFGSPSMAGTRPGGNIAMSWASLNALGKSGYMEMAKQLMEVTQKMIQAIKDTEELDVLGNPTMTCFAFVSKSKDIDILGVADLLEERGWKIERQQGPICLHCSILPHHVKSYEKFIKDIQETTKIAKETKKLAKEGTASMYGQLAMIPDKKIIDELIIDFFSQLYQQK